MEESVTINRRTYDDFMKQRDVIKALENGIPVEKGVNHYDGQTYYNVGDDAFVHINQQKEVYEKLYTELELQIEELAKILNLHTANTRHEQNIVTQIDLDRAGIKVNSGLFDRIVNYMWKRK